MTDLTVTLEPAAGRARADGGADASVPEPRVLVVEDDPEQAQTFARWLDDYYVVTAFSADDATDLISADTDVVLLDRGLPDASGDKLLETVRDAGYDGQVAMVTAMEPDFDIIEMGVDDYLQKPVSADELRSLVSRLLARQLYSEEVQRYFELSAKRVALEVEKDEAELEESDEYRRLRAKMAKLEEVLSSIISNLSQEDFLAVYEDLEDIPNGLDHGADADSEPDRDSGRDSERRRDAPGPEDEDRERI